MAAGSPEGDAHMEELVDHGLGMEETDQGLLRRPSLRETYHSDSLLAPDADFLTGREESITKIALPGKCSHVRLFVPCGVNTTKTILFLLVLIDDGNESLFLSSVHLKQETNNILPIRLPNEPRQLPTMHPVMAISV